MDRNVYIGLIAAIVVLTVGAIVSTASRERVPAGWVCQPKGAK